MPSPIKILHTMCLWYYYLIKELCLMHFVFVTVIQRTTQTMHCWKVLSPLSLPSFKSIFRMDRLRSRPARLCGHCHSKVCVHSLLVPCAWERCLSVCQWEIAAAWSEHALQMAAELGTCILSTCFPCTCFLTLSDEALFDEPQQLYNWMTPWISS